MALARGSHSRLADGSGGQPYVFSRVTPTDKVVIALGATGPVKLPVKGVFDDGARLRDAYTGTTVTVTAGVADLTADPRGVVLLEAF